jgi:catechol-2,3-dioxygenase
MLGPPLKDSDANATCRPNQLAHIVLQTKRLPELQAFFEQFLGARVAYENPRAVFMQCTSRRCGRRLL